MAPKHNPEYRKMLSIPAPPVDGPRKNATESLQKQIDFHVRQANQLRYAQNSHAPVSRLPPELLAEVFFRIVESGLCGNTRFATGTFGFLQVCRRWNEVAVGSPRLWGRWVAGAVKAWPLFNIRSKDTPLSLTWRSQFPVSARDVLMDPAIPRRIRRLDFRGTSEELVYFLGAFDSSPPTNVSSIRLQITPHDDREPREHLTRFFSSPFPKLSHLNLWNFLPNPSSSIFTTSSLTSLKLYLSDKKRSRHTASQFSQILRQHPNLRELDLNLGAIPLPGPPSASVPFTLPWLVSLKLYGTEAAILGFIDLIGMSSPLHDVDICFGRNPDLTVPALAGTVKRVLTAYYECQGLSYSRKVNRLAISYNSEICSIIFNTRSHHAPTLDPKSNLKLQFDGTNGLLEDAMVEETFPLFPLNDVHEFVAEGLAIYGLHGHGYRGMFQKMKHLSYLRLHKLDILPVLGALSSCDQDEPHRQIAPKLESLTLSHVNILFSYERKLLDVLKERRTNNVGLSRLVVRSCRVHKLEYESKLRKLVGKVKWDNVTVASR